MKFIYSGDYFTEVGESACPEKYEIELSDELTCSDMLDAFVHILHQLGYAKESVDTAIKELAEYGIESIWF